MDGIHDMGGMDGFGPVQPEADEPVFHAEWEGRVLALQLALAMVEVVPDSALRRTMERIPPVEYLRSSYYARWLSVIETLLRESGAATPGEPPTGPPAAPHPGRLGPAQVPAMIAEGLSTRVDPPPADAPPARFGLGDRVVAHNLRHAGHSRLPRFVRGRQGRVIRCHGHFPFADEVAAGQESPPQALYSVAFEARILWGQDASNGDEVVLDLWDPYLDPAP